MAAASPTITIAPDPQESFFWAEQVLEGPQHIDPSHRTEASGSDDDDHRGIGFTAPDLTGAHNQKFAKTAPRWRIIRPGLNLEAECKNAACASAETAGRVWLNCGIGAFKIGREVSASSCPECNQDFSDTDFKRFGFWQCKFVAEGFQTAPVKGDFSLSGTADRVEDFIRYSEGTAKWASLDVTTTPLDAAASSTPQEGPCIIV
ncbi:MAG: hypothetical protein P0S96_06150 [Simkaniaceae bacterium]|nr:hypothetical protein [Candidatus Sacchlamyda saccharinae]